MHKFLVKQTVEYESECTFTVFADNADEAKDYVSTDYRSLGFKNYLSTEILKFNIKGTKIKGVIKVSGTQYFQ